MRVAGLALLLLISACSSQSSDNPSPSPHPGSPTPAVSVCRLPVVWDHVSTSHSAFVSYPGGDIAESADIGDVYDAQYQRWVPGPRELVSPDGSRYTYWSFSNATPGNTQVHVVDVVSGVDRIIYDGATNYWPIAFSGDGIYALHAINLKQNSFEFLFRLDPAGGTPAQVRGSELLPQARWTLISGGSAWGWDLQPGTQQFVFRIHQLDLTTGTMTDWLHEAPNLQLSPIGLDAKGRLYLSDFYELWRLDAPNVEERLLKPPLVSGRVSLNIFVADAHGEWMGSWGGLWHYSDAGGAQRLSVATDQDMVNPAGPCM